MRKGSGLALLAAALCLLLTGCGGQKGGADTGASAPAESAQEGGPTSAREPATPEDAGDEAAQRRVSTGPQIRRKRQRHLLTRITLK